VFFLESEDQKKGKGARNEVKGEREKVKVRLLFEDRSRKFFSFELFSDEK
jgi:hypothetical protein